MAQLHIARPLRRPGKSTVARVLAMVAAFASRRRDRVRLGQLDPHLLRDIGIDAQEARAECAKPFWKP